MAAKSRRSALEFLPERRALDALREAAASCQGCDLYQNATQTVFGEGEPVAAVVLVGEQPGDQEDKQGRPFVGPAGRMLEKALEEAGMPRREVYITNAVKHFKWEPRGKRRLHKRPLDQEVNACNPWLAAELEAIRPEVVVCLGATAARALYGKTVRLKDVRGRFAATLLAEQVLVTAHPSALLRYPDPAQREAEYARFVEDLRRVREHLSPAALRG
jgi:uracil-DNA glycosylase